MGWFASRTFVLLPPTMCLAAIAIAAHAHATDPPWVRAIAAVACVSVVSLVFAQGVLLRSTLRFAARLYREVQRLNLERDAKEGL